MTLPRDDSTHDPPTRPAYRVPVGMPLRDEGRRQGVIVSVLVHAIIIALLLMPIVFARPSSRAWSRGQVGPARRAEAAGAAGASRARENRFALCALRRSPYPRPQHYRPFRSL